MEVLYIILAALVVFIAVLLIRAAAFRPQKEEPVVAEPEQFDREKAVRDLQALIRCKTVSYRDRALEDDAEFNKLYALLPELFPTVYKTCELTQLTDRSLLFHWKGKSAAQPGVLMAHYDVVPVNED